MSEPIAPGGLYSYRNQPPSYEVALARLHELEVAVQSIDVQLQHSNPNEFPDDDTFLTWKGRATGAMGHYKAEIAYLERWMGVRGSQSGHGRDGQQHVSSGQYRTGIEEIAADVQRMTTDVRQKYKRVYVEGNMPPDVAAARKRRNEFYEPMQLCVRYFKELKSKGEASSIGEEKMVKLRKPLSTLYMEMQAESKLIGKFIRDNEPQGERVDWTLFLLSLLERAVASGFVLTDKEKATVEEIRDVKLLEVARG